MTVGGKMCNALRNGVATAEDSLRVQLLAAGHAARVGFVKRNSYARRVRACPRTV